MRQLLWNNFCDSATWDVLCRIGRQCRVSESKDVKQPPSGGVGRSDGRVEAPAAPRRRCGTPLTGVIGLREKSDCGCVNRVFTTLRDNAVGAQLPKPALTGVLFVGTNELWSTTPSTPSREPPGVAAHG